MVADQFEPGRGVGLGEVGEEMGVCQELADSVVAWVGFELEDAVSLGAVGDDVDSEGVVVDQLEGVGEWRCVGVRFGDGSAGDSGPDCLCAVAVCGKPALEEDAFGSGEAVPVARGVDGRRGY